MYRITTCGIAVLTAVSFCHAAPFDLIVPSDVQIRTEPGIGGVGTPWGWVVATTTPLTYDQLKSDVFSLTTDNPSVVVTTTFYPDPSWMPMQVGDVAGLENSPFTDPLRDLLRSSEVVNPLSQNFWRWEIDFPEGFVGTVNLYTTLDIDKSIAVYDTLLHFGPSFGNDADPLVIVEAQRVSAVPEPSGYFLVMASVMSIFLWQRGGHLRRRCS
jgi:hypothetical protein